MAGVELFDSQWTFAVVGSYMLPHRTQADIVLHRSAEKDRLLNRNIFRRNACQRSCLDAKDTGFVPAQWSFEATIEKIVLLDLHFLHCLGQGVRRMKERGIYTSSGRFHWVQHRKSRALCLPLKAGYTRSQTSKQGLSDGLNDNRKVVTHVLFKRLVCIGLGEETPVSEQLVPHKLLGLWKLKF